MLPSVSVDSMPNCCNAAGNRLRSNPQDVIASESERLPVHPDHISGKLVGQLRSVVRSRQNVATTDIDFVFQRNGNRILGFGGDKVAIVGHDPLDARGPPRRSDNDLVSCRDPRHRPGIAPKIRVWPIYPLDRRAESLACGAGLDVNALQMLEQAGTMIPVGMSGAVHDVVAVAGRDRDRNDRGDAETGGKGQIVTGDPIEALFVICDKIDLVHCQHDMTNTEQRTDKRVAAGLNRHAFAGIDQEDGELGMRGAGSHIAGILLVAGSGRPP